LKQLWFVVGGVGGNGGWKGFTHTDGASLQIELSRRRDKLSFEHHKTVAPMVADEKSFTHSLVGASRQASG